MENTVVSADDSFDFNQIDVYQKEMFEVYSKIRNRSFRFVRYTGNNYTKLKDYIQEVSPNTQIWPESELRIGTLYGYSGRTFKFEPIIEYNIRCIIASNPYLKCGSKYKELSVCANEIEEYLKQSNRHVAFRYGDILESYKYNDQRDCFILYDRNHKLGIECSELPANDEWYIGHNDGLLGLSFEMEAKYQYSIHQVSIKPKIDILVDKIEKLKLNINRTCYHKSEAPIFAPSWEYYERILCMSKICITPYAMTKFANCMYSILFEETKVNGVNRFTLGDNKNDEFVLLVGELRNYYSHGNAEYEPWGMGIQSVFSRYLHNNIGPQIPNDFVTIQMGILEDFICFLEKISAEVRESLTVSGILMQDDDGHCFCGNAIVDPRFSKYKGCPIMSTQIITNTDDTVDQYPFYCYGLEEVEVNYSGKIRLEDEVLFCGNCPLPNSFSNMLGKNICIEKIGVRLHKKDPNRLLVNVKEWHPIYPAIDGIIPTVNIKEPCQLRKDSSGFFHVGNIMVNPNTCRDELFRDGDMIIMRKVIRNKNDSTKQKYPLFAMGISRVEHSL